MRALVSVVIVLLAALVVTSYGYMARWRARPLAALAELNECLRLDPRIESYSRRPALASDHEKISDETTSAIEEAVRSAGILPKNLVRITPESPQRINESVYKEKPTRVLLKGVTLKQAVEMLHGIASSGQGLYPKSLRLSAPRRDDTGDLWTVEVVVAYLIYEPLRAPVNGGIR